MAAVSAIVAGQLRGNRTAEVQGRVARQGTNLRIGLYFDAYAGGNKVDGDHRLVEKDKEFTDLHFFIGETNLPGGIDRIQLTLCLDDARASTSVAPIP